jgi:hypothetical protein
VPAANPPHDRSALEDGRLDELAVRQGMTIREVRRLMGHQIFARRRLAVGPHPAVVPGSEPDACRSSAVEVTHLGDWASSIHCTGLHQ